MRIAYVTTYDASEVRHYSGTAHFVARALEAQGAEVVYVGGLKERGKRPLQAVQLWHRLVRGLDHHRDREPLMLRGWAAQVADRLRSVRPDVILAPSSLPVAYLQTDVPTVLWPDATFASLVDFYPDFTGLSPRTLRHGHAAEQRALDQARLLVYSSEWAAQSAQNDYGATPEKVHVVPYGANLHEPPSAGAVTEAIQQRTDATTVRLLWLARGWHRKGGDVAVATAQRLHDGGVPVQLTMIGSPVPPGTAVPACVKVIPFLDKEDPAQRQRLQDALLHAHFLLLPTQADCTPIVFSEAAAYGLPVVTTHVGGIPSVIDEGGSGFALPPDADAAAYAACIEASRAPERYARLAAGAREQYERVLNWDVAGRRVMALLKPLLP